METNCDIRIENVIESGIWRIVTLILIIVHSDKQSDKPEQFHLESQLIIQMTAICNLSNFMFLI